MEKEIDGGVFSEIRKEELKKQANNNNGQKEIENQFITGDPSMITTDEVFALLGEQMVKAKNWSKIALAWNKNFNALKQSISQRELNIIEVTKLNKGLKESNENYIKTNQALDKRITELNNEIQHKKEEERESGKFIAELKNNINSLMKTTEEIGKENSELKAKIEIMSMKETKAEKKKKK
jgi:predicted RNase H-like nuclease (RuvC/YqgF family)